MSRWTFGTGIVGPMQPLLGKWVAKDMKHPDGTLISCMREFVPFGPGYVRLTAVWDLGASGVFHDIAFFGRGDDGALGFWSFTVDGARSSGVRASAGDIHPDAVAFVVETPGGSTRLAYWPAEDGSGFRFAHERRTEAGWERIFEHLYRPALSLV